MKWIIGVFVLAATIAVVASFPGTANAVNPDQALLRLFPADTNGVAFIDVAGVRDNPLVQELVLDRYDLPMPPRMREWLNPEATVQQAMLGRTAPGEILVVARADFDRTRLERIMDAAGVDSERYAGRSVYNPEPDDDWRIVLLDGMVMVGSEPTLHGALDRLDSAVPTALDNVDLIAAIEAIEDGHQVWAVGHFDDDLLPDGIAPPMATDLLRSLRRGSYQMRIDTDVTARAVGEFTTSETARRTTDLLRGFVALGKMQANGRSEMIQLLDGVRIDAVDSAVHIDFSANGDLLRRLRSARAQ